MTGCTDTLPHLNQEPTANESHALSTTASQPSSTNACFCRYNKSNKIYVHRHLIEVVYENDFPMFSFVNFVVASVLSCFTLKNIIIPVYISSKTKKRLFLVVINEVFLAHILFHIV